MNKGQTQVVSVIIIILVALGAIASVIPWANNMIQKRKDAKSTDDAFNFFQKMDQTIRNIAENGGEETLELKVDGILTIYPAADTSELNNSITFLFISKVANVATGDWIPLTTPNTNATATLGVDTPSVTFGRAISGGDILNVEYRLWYRSLTDHTTGRTFKININTTDNEIKEVNTGAIRIQRLGTKQIQDLTITEINIIV